MVAQRAFVNGYRPRYAHVLIDFDRTLNDSDHVFAKRLDGFLGLSGKEILRHWGQIHRQVVKKEPDKAGDADYFIHRIAERLSREPAKQVKKDLRARIEAAWAECWDATELYEESVPFLTQLTDAGYTLYIATGDYAERKASRIEEQAGRKLFAGAFDEKMLGASKGKRKYFDRALKRLRTQGSEVAIIGDSLKNDIAPGIEAGLATIWVRRGRERLHNDIRPLLTVKSLMASLSHFLVSKPLV